MLDAPVHSPPARSPRRAPSPPAGAAITPEMVRAEHEHALATLTPTQRRALDRLAAARNQSCFGAATTSERLARIIEDEARGRSGGPHTEKLRGVNLAADAWCYRG